MSLNGWACARSRRGCIHSSTSAGSPANGPSSPARTPRTFPSCSSTLSTTTTIIIIVISRPDCSWSSLVLPRECALRHGHGAQSLTLRKKTTNHSAPRVATTKLHAAIQTPTQIHAITHSATSLQQWEHLGNRIVTRNFFAISRPHTPIS